MMRCGMIISLSTGTSVLIVLMSTGRIGIVGHRFVIVFLLRPSRWRRAGDHRRRSKAL